MKQDHELSPGISHRTNVIVKASIRVQICHDVTQLSQSMPYYILVLEKSWVIRGICESRDGQVGRSGAFPTGRGDVPTS